MPVEAFKGTITVIDSEETAQAAVAALEKESIIGFDTETRPSFQKGKINKVALMQLSTADQCYLFRLNLIGMNDDLSRLLENESITKIGLSIHDDFHVMHRSSEVNPKGFVELQNMVKSYHIQDISLQKIYAILFGKKISKSQRLTNWEASNLTPQQQTYAATDAWACLEIYNYLNGGKFDPETSPYATPESEENNDDQ